MKTVFIGSKNEFDDIIVHWLQEHTDLQGVVWSTSAKWRKTRKGRIQYAWKRVRKYGLLKVIGEALLFRHLRYKVLPGQQKIMEAEIYEPYWRGHNVKHQEYSENVIYSENVNNKETRAFLEACQPDLVFAMCLNDFFGKKVRSIPKYGVLLWHEGLLPEYRGLYAPFWAMYKRDFDNIGWSVIRMNEVIDGGGLLAFGRVSEIDFTKHNYVYIGHKAILDSLPAVQALIEKIEAGTAEVLERPEAKVASYTYPTIWNYKHMRKGVQKYIGQSPEWL